MPVRPVAITPAMAELSLCDDAVARQFVPQEAELTTLPVEHADPIGDFAHTPVTRGRPVAASRSATPYSHDATSDDAGMARAKISRSSERVDSCRLIATLSNYICPLPD